MPYEVTAARKRPQTFEQLAGQEFVAATLGKSIATGRIAHAYLFSGPRGCGKTSTARILAKALNCETGPAAHPCGVCDSCRSIVAGSSLDVIEIDGASNTSVDNIRQIKDEVLFPPNSSRYKIYIIDEVHMLSTNAFNALLKTIEEPPPYVVFMFATTEPHKVPATIKSRCQQFTFRLVDSETIVRLLSAAAEDLKVAAEDEALLWIARESGGSIRDAYTLFDQIVSFAEGNITSLLIREKLGLVGQDRMNELFHHFVSGDTPAALAALDAILSSGVSPEQFVVDAVEYGRGLLLIKNGITREGLLGAPIASFDLSISESLAEDKVERLLSIFLSSYRTLKDSIDPRYELDLAVAKASHVADYVSPRELAVSVETLRRFVEQGGAGSARTRPAFRDAAPAISPATPAPSAPRATSREDTASQPLSAAPAARSLPRTVSEIRKELIAEIRKSNVLLATTLDKSREWSLDKDLLIIRVTQHMELDLLKRFVGILAEVLSQRLGLPLKIEIDMEDSPARAGMPSAKQDPSEKPRPEAETAVPELNPQERESIGLVERYFKATLTGVVAKPAEPAGSEKTAAATGTLTDYESLD